MHYKNGREVKIGDRVVGKDCGGQPLAGIVIEANPGTDTCNIRLLPIQAVYQWPMATAKDCLHIEDSGL